MCIFTKCVLTKPERWRPDYKWYFGRILNKFCNWNCYEITCITYPNIGRVNLIGECKGIHGVMQNYM